VIGQVRDFLATHREPEVILPGGNKIVERFGQFQEAMHLTCSNLHLDVERLTFHDLSILIVAWLNSHPLTAPAALRAGIAA
jgi:hypothetical protein